MRWDFERFSTVAAALATVALTVITAFLARYTYRLWTSTSDLTKNAEITAKRQLRAYLSVESVPQEWGGLYKTGTKERGTWTMKVQNTGQSPAKDVVADAVYDILPWPPPDHHALLSKLPQSEDSRTVIHPRQELDLRVPAFQDLSQDLINKAIAGTDFRLHIFGRITYKDIFSERRFTTFCITVPGQKALGHIFGSPQTRGALINAPMELDPRITHCSCNNAVEDNT